MSWRSGQFDRGLIHRVWHPFTPAHAADVLEQIDLQLLWDSGKRLLMLDVDNTLVKWRQEDFAEPVLEWIKRAKAMGFDICLVSNTNHLDRLARLRTLLDVETVRGRFKPSRAMFRLALIKFGRKPEEAIMVGDQLFTDVLGANRAGIDAIWVRKMEGREFTVTRFNRIMEGFFRSFIYKAIVAPIDEHETAGTAQAPLEDKPLIHQIVKFCLVGGTSFAIDYSIRMTLMFAIPYQGGLLSEHWGRSLQSWMPAVFGTQNPQDAFFPVAAAIAASFAILNSFIWNRLWTFEIRGKAERYRQLQRFLVISLFGLALNVLLSNILYGLLPFDQKWNARVATVVAAAVVAVWNFTGQRFYAFRQRSPH